MTNYNTPIRFEPQHPRLAVWSWDSAAGQYQNYSNHARSEQYGTFNPFKTDNDYLYIGLEEKFDLAIFYMETGGTLDRVEWEYYIGDGWEQFIGTHNYEFSSTGVERFDRLYNWRQVLIEEPMTNPNLDSHEPHNATPPDNIIRFWVRCKPVNLDTAAPLPLVKHITIRSYAEYATATDVSRILQLRNDFSYNTTPSKETVEDYIHNAESYVDYITKKSWRPSIVYDEHHEFNRSGFQLVKNFPTQVLKLEIWNGADWEVKEQGRNKEYFLADDYGMIYFSRFFILPARIQSYGAALWGWGHGEFAHPVRVTYIYGNNIYYNEREGGLVNDITKKLAAIDVLQNHDYTILFPSGTDKIAMERKSDLWRAEVDEKLESLRSWEVF